MELKHYDEILASLKDTMSSNQDKITDFSEGSIIHTLFMAVARQIERVYFAVKAGYSENLSRLAYDIFDIKKKAGLLATCKVQFSIDKDAETPIQIGAGTQVSDGTHIFETVQNCTIAQGNKESTIVGATAIATGSEYNLDVGAINKIETITCEATKVENTTASTGGTDEETQKELLARFKNFINGLQGNNIYGLRYAVLSVAGVRSCAVKEHFPPENYYNATVFIDDGQGLASPSLIQSVKDVINGTDEINGVKSAGVNIDVQSAANVDIGVRVTCYIYGRERSLAQKEITDTIQNYINGLGINEKLVLTTIIHALRNLSYVKDVQGLQVAIVDKNTTSTADLTWQTDNIAIDEASIARFYTGELPINNIVVSSWADLVKRN